MPGPSLVRGGVGSEQDSAAPPDRDRGGDKSKEGATARYVPDPHGQGESEARLMELMIGLRRRG